MSLSGEVDIHDVGRLKAAWVRQGSPACEHEHVAHETFYAQRTGYVACTRCGAFWRP